MRKRNKYSDPPQDCKWNTKTEKLLKARKEEPKAITFKN